MNTVDSVRHFAVRRVNPFEGVLQVVEAPDARAYSPDGRIWQIQVLADRPDHTWRSPGGSAPVRQFFNFGLWDAEGGLQRVPANPVMDIGAMLAAAGHLTDRLQVLHKSLPFPLIDDHECWATDDDGRPVALLASTEDPRMMCEIRVGRWYATRSADHGFVSASLLACGVPACGELGPRQHAEHLERAVRQRGRHTAWFHRLADGRGERLGPESDGALPADGFPELGLATDWQDAAIGQLAIDYLAWLAPALLMLQHIDDARRDWLEAQACRRPVALAAGYRLIPRVIDRARFDAVRVEARLRNARI